MSSTLEQSQKFGSLAAFRTFTMELSEEMQSTIEAVRELACA
jgi:hypothetical protein